MSDSGSTTGGPPTKVGTDQATAPSASFPNSKLRAVKHWNKKRGDYFTRLTRIYETATKCKSSNVFTQFLGIYSALEPTYNKWIEINDSIEQLALEYAEVETYVMSQVAVDELYDYCNQLYYALEESRAQKAHEAQESKGSNTSFRHDPDIVKLPRINLTSFDNKVESWNAFYDMFNSLIIQRESLTDTERMHYLRTCLSGEAADLIKALPSVADSFPLAIEILKERYASPRLLASHFVKALLDYKPAVNETVTALHHFLKVFDTSVQAFARVPDVDHKDFLLFFIALRTLSPETRNLFESSREDQQTLPIYDELIEFIKKRAAILSVSPSSKGSVPTPKAFVAKAPTRMSLNATQAIPVFTCDVCKGKHRIIQCPDFRTMNPTDRMSTIKSLRKCFNCLGPHLSSKCNSVKTCQSCGSQRHHSLLHDAWSPQREATNPSQTVGSQRPAAVNLRNGMPDSGEKAVLNKQPPTVGSPQISIPNLNSSLNVTKAHSSKFPLPSAQALSSSAHNQGTDTSVVLGTMLVRVSDIWGSFHIARAVLDPGSQLNFITKNCCDRLSLSPNFVTTRISGIGGSSLGSKLGEITIDLLPTSLDSTITLPVTAIVLERISNPLPSVRISPRVRETFSKLKLADPYFDEPSTVDILLGAELLPSLLISIQHNAGMPSALDTPFGHVIIGKAPVLSTEDGKSEVLTAHASLLSCCEINQCLQRFWLDEAIPDRDLSLSPEDAFCEEHFRCNVRRHDSGRYVVKMPFRETSPCFPNSRELAKRRLGTLERKLSKRPDFKTSYADFLAEYETLGHMEIAKKPSFSVLPHHGVVKAESTSTKLRVVFDGSARTAPERKALNELMLPGPRLQADIADLLIRFRMFKVVLCADIRMMYRQIALCPEQRHLQHIFWRKDVDSEIQEYELTTVTYGLTPSAFLSQRVLLQLAEDEGQQYPSAAHALKTCMYVDNFLGGGESIDEVLTLRRDLAELLEKGQLPLRKWASNKEEVVVDLAPELREVHLSFECDSEPVMKILGLQYNTQKDVFGYQISTPTSSFTKRALLSTIARMYDPMGLLAPVTFKAKTFLQASWLAGVGWDEELPPDLAASWAQFAENLPSLESLSIPRYIAMKLPSVQLVGFADASSQGYAACLYLVSVEAPRVTVSLLTAKTKLAPLKSVTIPRLELNACLLLARLYRQVLLTPLSVGETVLYSDSTTALSWIRTPPCALKTYVANRVSEILDLAPPSLWNHVPTDQNPADLASRGLLPQYLSDCSLWWKGPEFLTLDADSWPRRATADPTPNSLPEMKTMSSLLPMATALSSVTASDHDVEFPCFLVAAPSPDVCFLDSFVERFSSLPKVIKMMTYALRFVSNSRSRPPRLHGAFSIEERDAALQLLVKLTQQKYWSSVIKALNANNPCPKSLASLSPFVDDHGYLRVGGRLQYAPLSEEERHPVLLPRESRLALLIVDHFHLVKTLHGGPRLIQAMIQTQYWIPNIRRLIRSRIAKCHPCFRHNAKPQVPFMSPLPAFRFSQIRAFTNVGVDFAGPFSLKESPRRNAKIGKAYLAIFVCLSTTAVHCEIVPDLSTPAFLNSLERFTARRGLCSCIHSDRGTNFVGAKKLLCEFWTTIDSNKDSIERFLASKRIKWILNPPAASHFGGIWERAIASVRYHLKRSLGDRPMIYDEMVTLFTRIEAVLNSRPLGTLPIHPADNLSYLSPGHFLVGGPLLAPPFDEKVPLRPQTLYQRYTLIQETLRSFWKRWAHEYLQTLMPRTKWTTQTPTLQQGAVVLLRDERSPPNDWPIGRVIRLYPGPDGIPRVADVRLARGILQRPVYRLAPLPDLD